MNSTAKRTTPTSSIETTTTTTECTTKHVVLYLFLMTVYWCWAVLN